MNTRIIVSAAAAFGLLAGSAFAQSSTVTGAAGGAVTGAVVGGPVGAAVGGVAGAIVGSAIDPPPEKVVTYVQEQPMPRPKPSCRIGLSSASRFPRPSWLRRCLIIRPTPMPS